MRRALAVFLVACSSTRPTPTPTPPTPSLTPIPTPTPPPTQAPPPTPITIVDAAAAPASLDGEALEAWLKAHDVKVPKDLDVWGSCDVVRDDALFCRGAPIESLPTGESVFPLRVVVARSGLVLTAPIAAGPLDNLTEPGENADDYQYIILDAAFDGTTLTIAEKPAHPCDEILAQYKSQEWVGHRRMVQKACAARGRYVLRDGKLVRAP